MTAEPEPADSRPPQRADMPTDMADWPATDVIEQVVPHPPAHFGGEILYDEPTASARIGVVVPFDFELDWEYWRFLPEEISLFFTRTPVVRRGVGLSLARSVGHPGIVARATKAILSLDPAAVLYACSSGSFVNGLAGEQAIRTAMLDAGARAATTTSGAMLDALRACGIERIAVATPYTRPLTQRLVDFLHEAGFGVPSVHYLGLSSGIPGVSRGTIANLIRETSHPRADAVFVSCTALRTFGMVSEIEDEIGKPVFTADQVSLWSAIRAGRPEALAPDHPGWVIGGGHPMARSTQLLLEAATTEAREASA